ncbi:hypothetical protein NQ318_011861 [Aromia moschata]|uniref:Uncharacterized protein n=1 Tax=Aromia moschata TaxID=1265417 RepID=A0AAV8XJ15_9CUCU|nr:hypothetical protein NQ318_011861 [Aromia moschata]
MFSGEPCQLYCSDANETVIVPWGDYAVDGTPCSVVSRDVCISGICKSRETSGEDLTRDGHRQKSEQRGALLLFPTELRAPLVCRRKRSGQVVLGVKDTLR